MELNDGKIKVIAYYLPQYYPFKENDEWWGKGFTEWTNVGKAKPLFRGHYQPKVPADLGYYDLRVPEVAEAQAELAKEAGLAGFCYWHYWFGGGKTLMDMPIKRLLSTGKPDYPFCFAWANHSWYNKGAVLDKEKYKLLQEQSYLGAEDNEKHFYYCLDAFKDKRYMRYNNRPVFFIFAPLDFPKIDDFISQWNQLAKKEGIADKFYFIANLFDDQNYDKLINLGVDCVLYNVGSHEHKNEIYHRVINHIKNKYHLRLEIGPHKINYEDIILHCWDNVHDSCENAIPSIIPNWDHTPRSGRNGTVYVNSTPDKFERLAKKVFNEVNKKQNKMIMLKSWNEWGEGNYMEPDLIYGHGFIDALRKALNSTNI